MAETPSPMLRAERLLGQAVVRMRCCFQAHTDQRNSLDRSVAALRKILDCEIWTASLDLINGGWG